MRIVALALATTLLVSAPVVAQSAPDALKPNPVSIIIQVVPWLLKDGHPHYFVTARGHGRTTEEARTQALRAAVDQAVGSVVASEREVQDRTLTRSEVVAHAAGFVDSYEVKSVEQQNGLVVMTVDVWVRRSRLADRLLGEHRKPGHIDNDRLTAQTQTLDHSRKNGDALLRMVLVDFPHRAYDIEKLPSRVYYSDDRQKKLELNFVVRWRPTYVQSLNEALGQVSQNANAGDCLGRYRRDCQYQGYVTIKARPGTHGWSRTAAFDDSITLALVRQHLIHSRPAVLFTFWDQNRNMIWRGCHRYSDLDNQQVGMLSNERLAQPTDQGVQINTYIGWAGRAGFNLDSANPPALDRYEIAVVRGDQCPN